MCVTPSCYHSVYLLQWSTQLYITLILLLQDTQLLVIKTKSQTLKLLMAFIEGRGVFGHTFEPYATRINSSI